MTEKSPFEIGCLKEFSRELKKLKKKYRSLEDDLDTFINTQLKLFHKRGIDNDGIKELTYVTNEKFKFYKAVKFTCDSLGGRASKSGIRVIYAHAESTDEIEFIEIYYKGDKENEDRDRVMRYYDE